MNNIYTFYRTSSHHTPLCTTSPCTTPYTSAPSQAAAELSRPPSILREDSQWTLWHKLAEGQG